MKKKIKEILLGHACPGGSYDLDGAVEEILELIRDERKKMGKALRKDAKNHLRTSENKELVEFWNEVLVWLSIILEDYLKEKE